MSESSTHQKLVELIIEYVGNKVGQDYVCFIEYDVSREHSLMQYASYLRKCALYSGNAEYVMAVPWTESAEANNVVKKVMKQYPGDNEVKIIKGIV